MNPELDRASQSLDEALIAFSAGQTEQAYIRIHEAAMIVERFNAGLPAAEEMPSAKLTALMAMAKAA